MMGEPVGRQDRLFYDFDLGEVVAGDHLLRKIDAVLDLSWLRGELKPYYSHLGCPSICPELARHEVWRASARLDALLQEIQLADDPKQLGDRIATAVARLNAFSNKLQSRS